MSGFAAGAAGLAGAPRLEIGGLHVRFGGLHALSGVNVSLGPGIILGVIGPSGAGKSTLLDVICGRIRAASGHIMLNGEDVFGNPPWKLARAGVGRTHQVPQPLWGLTVAENVAAGALLRRPRLGPVALAELLGRADLDAVKDSYPTSLNVAQLRRLEFARASAGGPDLLLLDEPFAGLATTETHQAANMIRQAQREGMSILLVDHRLSTVAELCDLLLVLHHGQPLAFGPPSAVMSQAGVISAYLGNRFALQVLS